jgi:hypothetical protein
MTARKCDADETVVFPWRIWPTGPNTDAGAVGTERSVFACLALKRREGRNNC